MDSLTQIVLGGAVAAAIAPAGHRRAALLAGAALGTLPDLDALWLGFMAADPVAVMTEHRSFSHSLLVLPWVAALLWWLFKRFGNGRVAQSPLRWFWAMQLALVTHPLLDAMTVYGTQLWWPLRPSPAMGSNIFIIDPLYTVWLLLGCVLAWFGRSRPWAGKALAVALVVSSGYLGWSLLAKAQVDRAAQRSLAAMGLGDAPRFSVPMPFNTLLWRVVAMTPSGYVVADRSLVADKGEMQFEGFPSNVQALRQAANIPAVQRLEWFNRGFMRAQVVDGRLVLSDLRMGLEPDYTFNFAVAEQRDGQFRGIVPEQLRGDYSSPEARADVGRRLSLMWDRIWHEPAP
ncbi:metal-dependent hydrolase [Stenotrophomonas sp. SORGH_AS_0321]|uniref:metal-dependent hydrolase n=1 Tax=Stenotrophomonas sp. SORGH_AS_0321 TaxID=3041787 RepID=UPI002854B965|nr:metal-dependent hydrolase [Stenotrophomonas sp. SORGH_AS_0321]MDR6095738.1 inner membrane protein [Stenotrophomonas sp. SORGH_AS_0321]